MKRGHASVMLLAACALWSAPILTHAQTSLREASDVELHAAYCEPLLGAMADNLEAVLQVGLNAPNPISKVEADQAEKMVRRTKELREHVSAYILPRFKFIEPEEIISAENRGRADASTAIAGSLSDVGTLDAALSQRIEGCSNLAWLPF
jgi:hypothetical protein